MSDCIGGVGPGGKGPEDDDSATILTIKEKKPTKKMKVAIHPVPYIRFPMPLISGFWFFDGGPPLIDKHHLLCMISAQV
jgi:hypothetical protein